MHGKMYLFTSFIYKEIDAWSTFLFTNVELDFFKGMRRHWTKNHDSAFIYLFWEDLKEH